MSEPITLDDLEWHDKHHPEAGYEYASDYWSMYPRLSATLREAWSRITALESANLRLATERDAAIRENGELQAKLEAIRERAKDLIQRADDDAPYHYVQSALDDLRCEIQTQPEEKP